MRKLEEQILMYVEEALQDKEFDSRLLSRRAPYPRGLNITLSLFQILFAIKLMLLKPVLFLMKQCRFAPHEWRESTYNMQRF